MKNEKIELKEFKELIEIVKKLRSKCGCPWDMKQTEETLKPYVIEEAYEVAEAISSGNEHEIMEELGDLLLQVVFLSVIYQEKNKFSLEDVIKTINKKMIRRHPHVFDKDFKVKKGECLEEVILQNWERIKKEEKIEKSKGMPQMPQNPSVYVSETMPALHRAFMVQEKAKRIGLDFEDADGALNKVYEEIAELESEIKNKAEKNKESNPAEDAQNGIEEEYGDILFSAVNLGRLLGIHPCGALNKSSNKFIKRFAYIEENFSKNGDGATLAELDSKSLDKLWEESKKAL